MKFFAHVVLILDFIAKKLATAIDQDSVNLDVRVSFNPSHGSNCGSKIFQSTGRLISHTGYSRNESYSTGLRCRWEIESTKKGNITVRLQRAGFREFDYAVVVDGSLKHKLSFICNVERYKTLGKAGRDYLGINQALLRINSRPAYTSSTNKLLLDFCSHVFPVGANRIGFGAIFNTIPISPPLHEEFEKTHSTPNTTPVFFTVTRGSPARFCPGTIVFEQSRKKVHPDTRVVGGGAAHPYTWQWICSLVLGRRHQCGCTVIDEYWVVTAGHCFPRIIDGSSREPKMAVVIGTQDLKNARITNLFEMEKVVRHEEYINYRGISHDIALIKLKVPVQLKDNVQAACLPTGPLDRLAVNGSVNCAVAGWGVTSIDQVSHLGEVALGPDQLQQLRIDSLFSREECRKAVNKKVSDTSSQIRITETMFCAGYKVDRGGHDACQGDSGSPLMCMDVNGWTLHGLVSYGLGCASPGIPGVYTNLFVLRDWIQDTINKN